LGTAHAKNNDVRRIKGHTIPLGMILSFINY